MINVEHNHMHEKRGWEENFTNMLHKPVARIIKSIVLLNFPIILSGNTFYYSQIYPYKS